MDPNEIAADVPVFHRADPARFGFLTGHTLETLCLMAEVEWGEQTELVDISQLVIKRRNHRSDTESEVRNSRYGNINDLRRRITFEKLRGMLTDVFYSMKTSEIDFYAHQFKPVLRFIESATNRLLIADEVGLGKTIEAGLIWTEWQAREKARRLLVICPPTLIPKWIRELQDRFHIAAEATDANRLADLLTRFDRQGPGVSFALVTSYHALRPRKTERALLKSLRDASDAERVELERSLPTRVQLLHRIRAQGEQAVQNGEAHFLEMVVFDEAHAMKNTASASYFTGETFSAASGAAVCLSATPIHNNSRDLYSLLRLVDPEVFRDEYVFDLLREQNLPIVKLHNALSASAWKPDDISPLIESLVSESSRNLMRGALNECDGSPRGRVKVRHMAERMNLLGNFINRTRKRDVIERRVVRQPVTRPVHLTKQEMLFYRATLSLVRREVRKHGGGVSSFHLIHPALRMSSSIPVIAEAVANGKWGGFDEIELMADFLPDGFDSTDGDDLAAPDELRNLTDYDFEGNDSKYAALVEALDLIARKASLKCDEGTDVAIEAEDKIVIFAFFKSTIAYLLRRLTADGHPAIAVTGDVTDHGERDRIFRGFETDGNRILLCSEIGAEGVDLQFARVIVNYDLPWNPMRVEQRIGRIDRIGQKAQSIVIINFHVRDTIDGCIYAHLYNKIGIFEQSIGTLEGILGEEVAALTSTLLSSDLPWDQLEAQAEQTAEAVCQRAEIEAELENSTGALIAFQDLLSEQVGESQRLGRFIKPAELRLHAEDFLAGRYKSSDACFVIGDNPAPSCIECQLSFRALSDFEQFCQRTELPWPHGFSRHNKILHLAFDPSVHQQHKHEFPDLVLVTHLHPFFRWITEENASTSNTWHKVSALRVQGDDYEPGLHFYLVYRLTMEGVTRRDAFHYAAKHIPSGTVFSGQKAEMLLGSALDRGESLFPRDPSDHSPCLKELRDALAIEIRDAQSLFRRDQTQKLDIRRQQLTAHFDRRIEAQQRRIETAESRGVDPNQLKGFKKVLSNLVESRARQLHKLEDKLAAMTEKPSEVACGLIEVTPGASEPAVY